MNDDPVGRARSLVLRFGWNATAYQIINPGIDLWFSSRAEGVIGYVRHGRVRVVAGAPVCAHEDLRAVAAEFEREARDDGESVCYFGAEGRLEAIYHDTSTHAMVLLGAQPVWRPASWSGIIARHASLRAQLNRARNKGVTVQEWPAAKAHADPMLRRTLHEWLATRGLPPLHFLVEPETLERLFERRVFVAERDGGVVGFLVASPVPERNGWLVEQFVRGRGAPNGTAELMIDTAARAMADGGADYMTLGLAPLSHRGALPGRPEPFLLRVLLAWVRAHGRRFYNFGGLEAFKEKFHPEGWEPVYAILNRPRFSLAGLYAIAGAFSHGSPILLALRALWRAIAVEARRILRDEG